MVLSLIDFGMGFCLLEHFKKLDPGTRFPDGAGAARVKIHSTSEPTPRVIRSARVCRSFQSDREGG
jgi:hypothetical protein